MKALDYYQKIVALSLFPKAHPKRTEVETFLKGMQGVQAGLKSLMDEIMEGYRNRKSGAAGAALSPSSLAKKQTKIVESTKALNVVGAFDREHKNYMTGLYLFYVENRAEDALAAISSFVDRAPPLLEAYIDFWKVAAISGNHKIMSQIADTLSKLLQQRDYPNDVWIKSNIIIAKSLLRDETGSKYSEAKSVLQQLAQVLPPLPLPPAPEFDSLTFPTNPAFALLNTIYEEQTPTNDEGDDVVRSMSIIQNDMIAEPQETNVRVSILECEPTKDPPSVEVKPKLSLFAEPIRPPKIKLNHPQLDYVKKAHHEKRLSAFQEHLAVQLEVEKAAKENKSKLGGAPHHQPTPSARIRVFLFGFYIYIYKNTK